MRDEQSAAIGRFVRFRRRRRSPGVSFTVLRDRNGLGTSQPGASPKPLRYGLLKRFIDRRNAGRDGRSGCPEYAEQPEPTPYIKKLVAKFAEQAAAEHGRLDRDIALWRQALAKLAVDIQATEEASTKETHHDRDVQEWRQQRDHQTKEQLEAAIASRKKQCLGQQNQLAAHTWDRIETYWGRLVQIHPDGELMNEWINDWRPAQLAGTLQKLIALNELHRRDQSSEAIDLSEIN